MPENVKWVIRGSSDWIPNRISATHRVAEDGEYTLCSISLSGRKCTYNDVAIADMPECGMCTRIIRKLMGQPRTRYGEFTPLAFANLIIEVLSKFARTAYYECPSPDKLSIIRTPTHYVSDDIVCGAVVPTTDITTYYNHTEANCSVCMEELQIALSRLGLASAEDAYGIVVEGLKPSKFIADIAESVSKRCGYLKAISLISNYKGVENGN